MSWIENIRNKPYEQKIRLIWIIACVSAILLIGIWILSARFGKNVPKDTSLFQTIGKGVKDIKDNYKR